jgi:hypothetical protein
LKIVKQLPGISLTEILLATGLVTASVIGNIYFYRHLKSFGKSSGGLEETLSKGRIAKTELSLAVEKIHMYYQNEIVTPKRNYELEKRRLQDEINAARGNHFRADSGSKQFQQYYLPL